MISRILKFATKPNSPRNRPSRTKGRLRPNAESLERKDLLTGLFGHDLVFPAQTDAQLAKGGPQPSYEEVGAAKVADFGAAGVTNKAVTVELWVKPTSSGTIVSSDTVAKLRVYGVERQFPVDLPILSINNQGKLVGGLADSSNGKLYAREVFAHAAQLATPLQLSTSYGGGYLSNNGGNYSTVGDPNAIISQNSILDGNWHHIALVATPTSESLYLDGLLEGTHKGSYSLHFTVSALGGEGLASTTGSLRLGGTIGYRPTNALSSATDYAPGFSGSIDEFRVWSVARPLESLAGASLQPLLADAKHHVPGLVFRDGFETLHGGDGVHLGTSSVPIDAFPNLERLPGYQTNALKIAAPFDDVTLSHNFTALPNEYQLHLVRKVGLKAGDSISVTIKGSDSHRLDAKFAVGLYNESGTVKAVTLSVKSSNSAVLNTVTFFAPRTGTYKVGVYNFLEKMAGPASVEYYVNPGASNSLLELLSYHNSTTSDAAVTYRDINTLPNDTASSDDATRGNFPGYALIPHGPNTTPDQLKSAYIAILDTPLAGGDSVAKKYKLESLFNVQGSRITDVDSVNKLQADIDAINRPAGVTPDAFNSMKRFLTEVNKNRVNILKLIDSYSNLTTPVVDGVVNQNIPGTIAQNIVNSQMQTYTKNNPPSLKFPDKPGFDVNQFLTDTAVAAASKLLSAGANAVAPGTGSIIEPAVKILSQVLGFSTTKEAPEPTVVVTPDQNSSADITKVSSSIQNGLVEASAQLKGSLSSSMFRQVAMSNYGVLQLFAHANIKYTDDDIKRNLQAVTAATTYAAWKQILPAAYHWQAEVPLGTSPTGQSLSTLYETNTPYADYYRDAASHGASLWQYQIFSLQGGENYNHSRPVNKKEVSVRWLGHSHDFASTPLIGSFAAGILEGNVTSGSGSKFYTLAPANISETTIDAFVDHHGGDDLKRVDRISTYQRKVAFVVDWALQDSNGNLMSDQIASELFGVGSTMVDFFHTKTLTQLRLRNGGLYLELPTVKGAVTTWSDAFLNWGVPANGFKDTLGNTSRANPGVLLPRGTEKRKLTYPNDKFLEYKIDFIPPSA